MRTKHCRRDWLCPVCGYAAMCNLRRKLAQILFEWTAQSHAVALMTLTQSHCAADPLTALWDRLDDGWGAAVRGSGWRAVRKTFGVRGFIRITEVVQHRRSGWNVHLHVVLLLDVALDGAQLDELKDRLTARFTAGIEAAGGRALCTGQDLHLMEPHSEHRTASYHAKGTTARWDSDDSRTPMAILADLNETGEGFDLWQEFSAEVMGKKRRRYSASQGIDKLVRGTSPHINSPVGLCSPLTRFEGTIS